MTDEVVGHAAEAIVRGSSSFALASRLFGRALREDVWQLYAWCRHCDDVIDGQEHGRGMAPPCAARQREALRQLREQTQAALAGDKMADPRFIALQRVALKHRFAADWPMAMLDGFAMDVDGRDCERLDDMLAYCWCVAGVVGVMMATVMGVRDPAVLRRAQDLGLAFQITNICRDVREDAAHGRIYLPLDRIDALGTGCDPSRLLDPANRSALFEVVKDMLSLAEVYYRSARIGLRDLPFRAALAVAASRGIYREIGRRILRQGPEALSRRERVPRSVMLWLLLRGALLATWSRLERWTPRPARPALWSHI